MKPSQLGAGSSKTDRSFEFTADFLAAIFTWGGVGWVADRLLDTPPVLMVVGFVVGNTTGIYLLYIRARDAASVPEDTPRQTTTSEPHPDGS